MSSKKKLDDYTVGDAKVCLKKKAKYIGSLVKKHPYLTVGLASVLGLILGTGLGNLCKRKVNC